MYFIEICYVGSKLEQEVKEFQDCPVFAHGPLEVGAVNPIPLSIPMLPGSAAANFGGGGDYSGQGHFPRGQQMGGPSGGQGGQFHGGRGSFSGGGRGEGGRGGRGDSLGRGRGDGGRGRGGGGRGMADASGGSSYYQLQAGAGAVAVAVQQAPSVIQGLPGPAGTRKKTRFE
jgi:hypothetical protein